MLSWGRILGVHVILSNGSRIADHQKFAVFITFKSIYENWSPFNPSPLPLHMNLKFDITFTMCLSYRSLIIFYPHFTYFVKTRILSCNQMCHKLKSRESFDRSIVSMQRQTYTLCRHSDDRSFGVVCHYFLSGKIESFCIRHDFRSWW